MVPCRRDENRSVVQWLDMPSHEPPQPKVTWEKEAKPHWYTPKFAQRRCPGHNEAVSNQGSNSSHRFCVVTALTLSRDFLRSDLFEPYATVGMRGISAYTNRHGYTFHPIFFQGPGDEHPGWQRVRLTLQLLRMNVCDWAFWMEGDMFITNCTRTLDDILAAASPANSKHFVFSCDPTLNTGAGFIRNSANAIATLEKVLDMRTTHGQYAEVMKIEHNGAFMILQKHKEYNKQLLLAPQRLFNSYPTNWKPGDLLVHFPGLHKKEIPSWLRKHPPHTWDNCNNLTYRAQTSASAKTTLHAPKDNSREVSGRGRPETDAIAEWGARAQHIRRSRDAHDQNR